MATVRERSAPIPGAQRPARAGAGGLVPAQTRLGRGAHAAALAAPSFPRERRAWTASRAAGRRGLWGRIARSLEGGLTREPLVAFLLGVLLLFAIGGLVLAAGKERGSGTSGGQGDTIRQAIYALTFLGVLVASGTYRYPRRLLALPMTLIVALGWCWASLAWSVAPGMAVRRLILTTMVIWTVFQCVQVLGYEHALTTLRRVLVLTLAANFVMVAVAPGIAIHQAVIAGDPALAGDWRGILPQKNFAGALCAITILAFVFDARRIPSLLRTLVIVAALAFLYKTHSKTSMGLLGLTLVIGFCYTRYNPLYRALVVMGILAGLLLAGIVAWANWDLVVAHFNRPDSLTGRGEIWTVLLGFFRDHWVLGAGFGSFWGVGADSPAYHYAKSKSWVLALGNGHNGYLDLLVQIGLPGLLVIVATLIVWPIGMLLTNTGIHRGSGALLLAMLVFCAAHNMTETSLMDRDMIVQVLLMLTTAMLFTLVRTRAPGPRPNPSLRPHPESSR